MKKTGLSMIALAGVLALGSQVTFTQSAHAAGCADDVAMVKEMAMAAEGDAKEMALKHVGMAQEKADANNEADCLTEVSLAKDALGGDAMGKDAMAKDAMAKDGDAMAKDAMAKDGDAMAKDDAMAADDAMKKKATN